MASRGERSVLSHQSQALIDGVAQSTSGRIFEMSGLKVSKQDMNDIWHAFGNFIARQIRSGKGVGIPKLGNFTFSAADVDLAGTTNPMERDKQFRNPVFLIAKDFTTGIQIRTGICGNTGQVRPFDIKGASGIIPKVKVNYTDIGVSSGKSKDYARNAIERVIKNMSDRVKRGEDFQVDIPFTGTLIIKHKTAAVHFEDELLEDTRGVTVKNHFVGQLFSSNNNKHHMQQMQQNQSKGVFTLSGKPGITQNQLRRSSQNLSTRQSFHKEGMIVSQDGEEWLRRNLGINATDLTSPDGKILRRTASAKPRATTAQKIGHNNYFIDGGEEKMSLNGSQMSMGSRPQSAYSGTSTRTQVVPDVSKIKLLRMAQDILGQRQAIIQNAQITNTGTRAKVSASEHVNLLKKSGVQINIGHLKALLKEMNLQWYGVTCNVLELIKATKEYTMSLSARAFSGQGSDSGMMRTYFSQGNRTTPGEQGFGSSKPINEILLQIKDALYSSGEPLRQVYEKCQPDQAGNIGRDNFIGSLMHQYGVPISEPELFRAFNYLSRGGEEINFDIFKEVLSWEDEFEDVVVLRKIRSWMYQSGLASEQAFEQLCHIKDNHTDKRLSRVEFHKAMNFFKVGLSAAQIDHAFRIIDANQDGIVNIKEWMEVIFEDASNPLQLLREIIHQNGLTSDDLLFRMKLRIWDDPLNYKQFAAAIRQLDPSFTDVQIKSLAKILKNDSDHVDVVIMIRNLCGEEFETIDYRNKIYKNLYQQIYASGKGKELKDLFTQLDVRFDGTLEPHELKIALLKVIGTKSMNEETVDRFVRFLDKTSNGRVDYMKFIDAMAKVSNREHNPLKSIVQRLQFFLKQNKQDLKAVLRRLSGGLGPKVTVETFAQFLKSKIDKKRDIPELEAFAYQIDVNHDGYIDEYDIQTCIGNLNNDRFYQEHGEQVENRGLSGTSNKFGPAKQMTKDQAAEVCKQIRQALITHNLSFREFFNRLDSNSDGLLNYAEFTQGVQKVISLSQPAIEQLFAYMDVNQIGMVDYENFLKSLQTSAAQAARVVVHDNFDWEMGIIDKIKNWIQEQRLTIDEAFKIFDKNFDGYICQADLKSSLQAIFEEKVDKISSSKIDRLFSLMDYYKTGKIQLSDFYRVIQNEDPCSMTKSSRIGSASTFKTSSSVFDWKLNAIRQIGLFISKKFASLGDSYEFVSERLGKITLQQFRKYIESNNVLQGLNMTYQLIQQLFSELDPHKKGFLTEDDWHNAFGDIHWRDELFIELKNLISCSFTDSRSFWEYLVNFNYGATTSKAKDVSKKQFQAAVNSLAANRFGQSEITSIWNSISEGKETLGQNQFGEHFSGMRYAGKSSLKEVSHGKTTLFTESSVSQNISGDIIEKLRYIIKTSKKTLIEVFRSFDADGNGKISSTEFRQALRKLNLGVTAKEIDQVLTKIDKNGDGHIDWSEFMLKFGQRENDVRIEQRTKNKLAKIKELMLQYMSSPKDAFRYYDSKRQGKLTYTDFSQLIVKLYQQSRLEAPSYPVIKDLFDFIDVRKDGIIDASEWTQSFNQVQDGAREFTVKQVPKQLVEWENTLQFKKITSAISQNRKMLNSLFESKQNSSGLVSNADGTTVLQQIVGHMNLEPEQYQYLLQVAVSLSGDVDFKKLLRIYCDRASSFQQHPKGQPL